MRLFAPKGHNQSFLSSSHAQPATSYRHNQQLDAVRKNVENVTQSLTCVFCFLNVFISLQVRSKYLQASLTIINSPVFPQELFRKHRKIPSIMANFSDYYGLGVLKCQYTDVHSKLLSVYFHILNQIIDFDQIWYGCMPLTPPQLTNFVLS
jgi:hypothetical protein